MLTLSPFSLFSSSLQLILILNVCSFPSSHSWTTTIALQSFVPISQSSRDGSESLFTPDENLDLHIFRTSIWYNGPFPGFPFQPGGPNDAPPGPSPALLFTTLCTNIPPNYCCHALAVSMENAPPQDAFQVTFMNLGLGTVGGVWQKSLEVDAIDSGCNGDVLETRLGGAGPPRWTWRDPAVAPRISGASYAICPPDPVKTVLGPFLVGLCRTLKWGAFSLPPRNQRNGNEQPGAGKISEPNWMYPDIIVINGTNFTDGRRGDLIYRDGVGNVLNLTQLRFQK